MVAGIKTLPTVVFSKEKSADSKSAGSGSTISGPSLDRQRPEAEPADTSQGRNEDIELFSKQHSQPDLLAQKFAALGLAP
jgi:hypothetical protein